MKYVERTKGKCEDVPVYTIVFIKIAKSYKNFYLYYLSFVITIQTMKSKKGYYITVFFLVNFLVFFSLVFSQQKVEGVKTGEVKPDTLQGNKYCLKCHGNVFYELTDKKTGKVFKKTMNIDCIIDTLDFAKCNHRTFQCTSCHSDQFKTFPHPEETRFEEIGSCVECHSGDSIATVYKFDLIEADFQKSVHATKHNEYFNCWMCHDAHTYKVKSTTIAYDNSICLSCHANTKKYNMILNKDNPNIITKHEWLPNQEIHFQNVRCIECHARVNDSILVAHNIQPKLKAVKLCVECHSTNSLLRQTLYKYQSSEQISKNGFFNAVILNKSYVIGANRNYFLNVASVVILIIVLIGIIIHSIFRFSIKK
jgi:predicted CXXCH cytochrome family protein